MKIHHHNRCFMWCKQCRDEACHHEQLFFSFFQRLSSLCKIQEISSRQVIANKIVDPLAIFSDVTASRGRPERALSLISFYSSTRKTPPNVCLEDMLTEARHASMPVRSGILSLLAPCKQFFGQVPITNKISNIYPILRGFLSVRG